MNESMQGKTPDASPCEKMALAYRDELASEQQRSNNYLQAVLATALAYIDANLTADRVFVKSSDRNGNTAPHIRPIPTTDEISSYSDLQAWICDNLVCGGNDRYRRISSREYLLRCFERGDGRASVMFSVASGEGPVPCREIFYLYRDHATDEVHVFCVIYDLTDEQRRDKELAELKQELDMSRIRNSTSQMKPHFLYNALGSIQEVILTDPEKAAGLLEDFTVHLRSCIKAMDSDRPIPFVQELENIKAYTNIERMRFGDRLRVNFELEETGFSVLPLTVQPLVENAIRHGVYQRGAAGGTVTLRTWAEDDVWVVQVEDTGVGFDVGRCWAELQLDGVDSTGLRNIRLRLEKIMGAMLDVTSTVGVGTTATIRIPRRGWQ